MRDLEKDFNLAGEMIDEVLDDFEASELDAGAALGGAMTALVFRIILSSPDASTAMGMISSSMASGARLAAHFEDDPNEVRH
jgi:hypothetical protein